MTSRADALLAGPRGRRLCLDLTLGPNGHQWPPLTSTPGPAGYPIGRLDPQEARRSLAAAVAALDLDGLVATGPPSALLPALREAVDSARYWQEADDADQMLTDPFVAAVLAPVADAVARAPAAQWWTTPLSGDHQHAVAWPDGDPPVLAPRCPPAPPGRCGAGGKTPWPTSGEPLGNGRSALGRPGRGAGGRHHLVPGSP